MGFRWQKGKDRQFDIFLAYFNLSVLFPEANPKLHLFLSLGTIAVYLIRHDASFSNSSSLIAGQKNEFHSLGNHDSYSSVGMEILTARLPVKLFIKHFGLLPNPNKLILTLVACLPVCYIHKYFRSCSKVLPMLKN